MKKLMSLILAFAMILSLAVPAMAAEPTINGNTSGEVKASFDPDVAITGITFSGEHITYDEESGTYIFRIPVNATNEDEIPVYVNIHGTNLKYAAGEDEILVKYELAVGEQGFTQTNKLSTIPEGYIQDNENIVYDPGWALNDGLTATYCFSNDNGTNWSEPVTLVYKQAYAITVNTAVNGTVTAPASAVAGETVNLTVTPAEGFELDTLTATYVDTDGATQTLTITDNTFTMPASAVTVTATFKEAIKYYTVTVNPSDNGTVAVDPTTYTEGQTVTLAVNPAEGYELDTLTATYVDADGATQTLTITDNTFVMPAANVTVTATFKAIKANMTGLVLIVDGTEYTSGTVTAKVDSEVILKVVGTNLNYANDAYVHVGVSTTDLRNFALDESNTFATMTLMAKNYSTDYPYELKYMNAGEDWTQPGLFIQFEAPTYAVNTGEPTAYGTITATPNPAKEGEIVTVTVTPEVGYEYVVGTLSVLNDTTGEEVAVDEETKTFVMPASSVSVGAVFEKLEVTSADITWGSMDFTYTDGEDGDEGAWSNAGTEDAGTVTVTNTGDTGIEVTVEYTAEEAYNEIAGVFHYVGYDVEYTEEPEKLPAGGSLSLSLTLSGEPKKAIPAGTKIGTVTVTIEEYTGGGVVAPAT